MAADSRPRTVGDELVRAADRDIELYKHLEGFAARVVEVLERVGQLEADLAAERLARERLELRVNAEWLRDRGYSLRVGDDEPGGDVVPLIRRYAADTEPLPTTDEPTLEGGDAVA